MSDEQQPPPLVPPGPALPEPDPTHIYLYGPPPPPPRALPVPPATGYPPYPPFPAFQPYLQPPPRPRAVRALAVAAIVTAAVLLATQVAEAITAWPSGRGYALAWQRGESADFNASWDVASWTALPALVIAYIGGAWWLWRARSNVAALFPGARLGLGRGWAWAGWVTPVVALWFPILVVRDTWRASAPGVRRATALALWWSCWLVWLASEAVVPDIVFDRAPANTWLLGLAETANGLVCGIAFASWVLFIRRTTRAQTTRLEEFTGDRLR